MIASTEHPHVVTDTELLDGEPIVKGTRTPVRRIVETWRLGGAAERIPRHLPHLSLAQVFDALSYYGDHEEEINQFIEQNRIVPTSADDDLQPVIPEGSWEEHEEAKLIEALERTNWNITHAAQLLGMTFRTLQYRMEKFGIERP